LQHFINTLKKESLPNTGDNYLVKFMVLIFALHFLLCKGIFMRNPYFHFAKPRGSVGDHLRHNGLEYRFRCADGWNDGLVFDKERNGRGTSVKIGNPFTKITCSCIYCFRD